MRAMIMSEVNSLIGYEYINVDLPNGEQVRFKREWAGHRFTDDEVDQLGAGMEITISSQHAEGVRGSLDWQEFNGYEYYGFAPWDAEAYTRDIAPIPHQWNGHAFTDVEKKVLRSGERVRVLCLSKRTGGKYDVELSFTFLESDDYGNRWGIHPHFEDFGKKKTKILENKAFTYNNVL